MLTDYVDLITCLTRFLDEETRNMPTVCSPNCSRCRIHIMTTVGTQGEFNVPDMDNSATSSMERASSIAELWELSPKLWRRKSNRLSVEAKRASWTLPKEARESLREALETGLKSCSSVVAGMSIPVVAVAAHVDRLRLEGRSTHWPRGTPKTGPGVFVLPAFGVSLAFSAKIWR